MTLELVTAQNAAPQSCRAAKPLSPRLRLLAFLPSRCEKEFPMRVSIALFLCLATTLLTFAGDGGTSSITTAAP